MHLLLSHGRIGQANELQCDWRPLSRLSHVALCNPKQGLYWIRTDRQTHPGYTKFLSNFQLFFANYAELGITSKGKIKAWLSLPFYHCQRLEALRKLQPS